MAVEKSKTEEALSKALKGARTVDEMVESFAAALPGGDEETVKELIELNKKAFSVFIDKKPHMWEEYAQKPFYNMVDRGILDPKTRELICTGIMMALRRRGGTIFHMLSAICNGATEEEIMEVAFLTCYVQPKIQMTAINDVLSEGLQLAARIKKKGNSK